MFKLVLKIVFVIIIAVVAVYYHNTESGKKLEEKISSELEYEQLRKRGKKYVDKTMDYIVTKGLDKAKKMVRKPIEGKAGNKLSSSSGKDNEKKEDIKLDERKKLEQIIEKDEYK